jgi:ENTH domain
MFTHLCCRSFDIDAVMSAADYLIQDLLELIKSDKRTLTGGESGVQEKAAETVKAVKSALGKIRQIGKDYLRQQSSGYDSPITPLEATTTPPAGMEDDIYVEAAQNDIGEEEARIAFAMFFLCMYGDMRWYLMPGPTPQLDRDRFLQQKRAMDREALYPLYQNMCHSQMFEQFVNERVEEIRNRVPITRDSTLFAVCADYHRKSQIDFTVMSVRRVARQMAQANPGRLVYQASGNARRLALSLTSNKTFEGNHGQAVAQLVEMAHETSSVLCEVMSVIWMRLNDSRGMQWKHALFSLQILRNLLLHGPLAAISEATDGLDRIRKFKAYTDTMRGQNCQQIQRAASEVYSLLVDRAKLFSIRRLCADRRRIMKNPPQGQVRQHNAQEIPLFLFLLIFFVSPICSSRRTRD